MTWELVSYGFYGAGYIAYLTFIVAYLRNSQRLDSGSITVFWAVLGLTTVVAPFAWGPLFGQLKGRLGRSHDDEHRGRRGLASAASAGSGRCVSLGDPFLADRSSPSSPL